MPVEVEAPVASRRVGARPITIFLILQVLDVLTTLIGLRLGASEGNGFVGHLIQAGPLTGLVLAKILAAILAACAIFLGRRRVLVFLNYWFAAVVTWNLIAIWVVEFRSR